MSRSFWLPMPIHSLLLFIVWLLLNNTVAPGHIVLGAFLSLVIPILCAPLKTEQPHVRRPLLALKYILKVLGDIVVCQYRGCHSGTGTGAPAAASVRCRAVGY